MTSIFWIFINMTRWENGQRRINGTKQQIAKTKRYYDGAGIGSDGMEVPAELNHLKLHMCTTRRHYIDTSKAKQRQEVCRGNIYIRQCNHRHRAFQYFNMIHNILQATTLWSRMRSLLVRERENVRRSWDTDSQSQMKTLMQWINVFKKFNILKCKRKT